ncbi:YtxH domain-containing protein [Heyndrickxia oleronia]|uniref:YtxH domain-containing protein n=1 Tax=Heyndrickxia oleronia TaxID=38875 RepID=UPI001B09019C|nr:YtxH domain-containing protein [Heyndrickxia oleronia]GIN37979.1 hypothetical protein J19TS1_09280 [Heyndrickxia oleronia]
MNKKSLLFGLIVGGVAGSITALLSAPSSGKELRQQLTNSKDEWIATVKDMTKNANELKKSIHVLTTEGKEMAVQFITDVKSSISEWQNNIETNKENIYSEVQSLRDTIEQLESQIKKEKS